MAKKSRVAGTSGSSDQPRARIAQEYDRLISQFGEDPFLPAAVCQRTEGLTKVLDEAAAASPKSRHELLKEVTQRSLHCAQLIEKALAAAEQFKRSDEKIAEAYRRHESGIVGEDSDKDEEMEASDDEDDGGASAVLLRDLITASEDVKQAQRNLARVGVVTKSTKASRDLLSSSETLLQASVVDETPSTIVSDEFRDLYMEEFTTAFGDELDQFRQEDRFESKDVTYLISAIQSGADIFTPLQKKLFVESAQAGKSK